MERVPIPEGFSYLGDMCGVKIFVQTLEGKKVLFIRGLLAQRSLLDVLAPSNPVQPDAAAAGQIGNAVPSGNNALRPSLRERVDKSYYHAREQTEKNGQLAELLDLLQRNPEVARILDLIEATRV